mmetsp:Transcript_16756/g.40580  ORF Transcript_16756/g.40580 Transcript_16756/m.40580 type:complete len:250 (+) Transcript_16756:37-786(+)
MGVASIAAYVGLALFMVFNVKSTVVYWTWTRDAAIKDLMDSPLLTPWGMHPAVVKAWTELLSPYFDPKGKQGAIRMHMAVSMIITLLVTFNLVPMFRKKFMFMHRWLGRICITFAIINAPGFYKLVMNFGASKITQYIELPIIAMIVFFGIQGWVSVRDKNIQAHRSSMIMFSCCFFFFGVQRICLLLAHALHSMPTTSQFLPLGPISKISGADYWEVMWGLADVSAFMLTFGLGAYNAYGPRIKAKSA